MNAPLTDRGNHSQASSSLDVFLLGTVDLESSKELQERLRSDVATRTDSHGAILICEHPPSVTIGREGSFADVLVEWEELVARKMDVRWLNRGGGTFVHVPVECQGRKAGRTVHQIREHGPFVGSRPL